MGKNLNIKKNITFDFKPKNLYLDFKILFRILDFKIVRTFC